MWIDEFQMNSLIIYCLNYKQFKRLIVKITIELATLKSSWRGQICFSFKREKLFLVSKRVRLLSSSCEATLHHKWALHGRRDTSLPLPPPFLPLYFHLFPYTVFIPFVGLSSKKLASAHPPPCQSPPSILSAPRHYPPLFRSYKMASSRIWRGFQLWSSPSPIN